LKKKDQLARFSVLTRSALAIILIIMRNSFEPLYSTVVPFGIRPLKQPDNNSLRRYPAVKRPV
jgi:hypothetical protein